MNKRSNKVPLLHSSWLQAQTVLMAFVFTAREQAKQTAQVIAAATDCSKQQTKNLQKSNISL